MDGGWSLVAPLERGLRPFEGAQAARKRQRERLRHRFGKGLISGLCGPGRQERSQPVGSQDAWQTDYQNREPSATNPQAEPTRLYFPDMRGPVDAPRET